MAASAAMVIAIGTAGSPLPMLTTGETSAANRD
jgi:hypothetical protein